MTVSKETRLRDSDAAAGTTGVILTVPSHPRYLYTVRSMLYPLAIEAGFTKKTARHIVLAVDEACSNIIKHAYGGDHSQSIVVTVEDRPDRFIVTLRDYGKKVDRAKIAPRDLADVRPGGLGTHFMAAVFETVRYDTGVEQGTLLVLEKLKQQGKS